MGTQTPRAPGNTAKSEVCAHSQAVPQGLGKGSCSAAPRSKPPRHLVKPGQLPGAEGQAEAGTPALGAGAPVAQPPGASPWKRSGPGWPPLAGPLCASRSTVLVRASPSTRWLWAASARTVWAAGRLLPWGITATQVCLSDQGQVRLRPGCHLQCNSRCRCGPHLLWWYRRASAHDHAQRDDGRGFWVIAHAGEDPQEQFRHEYVGR